MKSSPLPVRFEPKYGWILFFLFFPANALIAYFHGSLSVSLEIFFLGIMLPWVVGYSLRPPEDFRSKPLFQREFLSPPSRAVLGVLLAAAAFLRFTQLTTLSLWPLTDEAKSGYYSMEWVTHGSFRLLYDFSQLPPLFIWLQGFFFKFFGVSLFSLWCLPAILSLLTVLAAYTSARVYFSKSFSLLLTGLMAFSFWPLYVGRFSHPGGLLLFWECAAFGIFGWFLQAKDAGRSLRAFLLGAWVGAGFYTFTSWPTVALVLGLWVFIHSFFRLRKPAIFFIFSAGALLVYAPLGTAWLQEAYGGYIRHVWMFYPQASWGPQLLRAFSDLAAFFWKSVIPENLFAYKPFWGGYLNPALGACFFVGVLALFRSTTKTFRVYWLVAFAVFFIPGFLTGGVEMFRVLPEIPVLLLAAGWGLAVLLDALKPKWRTAALAGFFLVSLGLDSYHLFGVYHGIWTHPKGNWFASKSVERLRAYSLLKDRGPGLVLSELGPDLYDQSLSIATYEFNIAENPRLSQVQPRWVALLTNIHYQPYLAQRFPEGQWVWLAGDVDRSDGGLMLAILPWPDSHPETLGRWIRADLFCQGLVPQVFDNRDYKSREPVIQSLLKSYSLFRGDPYLESCFWEKISDNEYGDRNWQAQIDALQQAVQRGIPAAHLYNNLGALWLRHGHLKEARLNFLKAIHTLPNHTSASAGLQAVDQMEKTGQFPVD